jgi:hypothetical protein
VTTTSDRQSTVPSSHFVGVFVDGVANFLNNYTLNNYNPEQQQQVFGSETIAELA